MFFPFANLQNSINICFRDIAVCQDFARNSTWALHSIRYCTVSASRLSRSKVNRVSY